MTVDTLSCGHCPRNDFDSFNELREHVEQCRSGVTRECPTCGLVTDRLDLTITEDGKLVCPGCGEVITSYGVLESGADHLLLSDKEKRSGHAAHKPSDYHPLIPLCDTKFRQTANDNYRPIPAENAEETRASICTYCREAEDPDENAIDRSNEGTTLAKKLERLADGKPPEEVGLVIEDDDLIADGGTTPDSQHFDAINDHLDAALDALDAEDADEASFHYRQASQHAEGILNGGHQQ